jgi:hypothetical protein
MASEDWQRRERRAWEIGYESATQRRELRASARDGDYDELYRNLDSLIAQRAAEEDYGSIGEIFADIYEQLPDEIDRTTFLRGIFSPAGV